jgi:small-conductance mechanosensitive channel
VLTLFAVVSAERVHDACGANPGFLCRKTLELTGDRTLAEAIELETREISLRAEQRIEALASVLGSVATFVVWSIAAFMVLGQLGIELGPLLAGAGILGVAIGFGSQALVRDFLSGVFILIEDQLGVGDIVDIDGQTTGTVEAVSLRMTRLRGVDGALWHVPNGEIRRVGNKSQHWSRALRAQLKGAFEAADIEIPFPQQTVWHRTDPRQPA